MNDNTVKKTGILFDLDGTLWDTCAQIAPVWSRVLAAHGCARTLTASEVRGWMGKTVPMIAEVVLPEWDEAKRIAVLEECCAEENLALAQTGGTLYPRVPETLRMLRERYALAVVSNCQDGYIQTFLAAHGLADAFDDFECIGRTGRSKSGNIRLVIERLGLEQAVYLGDTEMDCQAAREAGIPFLWAAYGFGSLPPDTPKIERFDELPEAADRLFV